MQLQQKPLKVLKYLTFRSDIFQVLSLIVRWKDEPKISFSSGVLGQKLCRFYCKVPDNREKRKVFFIVTGLDIQIYKLSEASVSLPLQIFSQLFFLQ